jgi:hypothetical protein
MPSFRRRLSWILAGWLVCQFAGLVAPVALAAAGVVEDLCTCPGTQDGATCPMHHDKGTPTDQTPIKDQASRCVVRSAAGPTDVALWSLSSGGGVLPQAVDVAVVDSVLGLVTPLTVTSSSRPALPDAPPPRA